MIAVLDGWRDGLRCAWHRNASAFVWTIPLLLAPILDLHGSAGDQAFQLTLLVVIAAAALVAAVTGAQDEADPRGYVALSTMFAATFAGATHHSSQWLPTWVLLANVVPAVVRGRRLLVAIPVVAAASMWAAAIVEPHQASRVWAEGFVVLLAGAASSAFAALIDTVAELRRTRQELARVAVAEERERFARDLHDLLGHTLSVMVVKAQAVRRLAATDPDAAVGHAADIEQIGRRALGDVRQAVDAMRGADPGRRARRGTPRARRRGHRHRGRLAGRGAPVGAGRRGAGVGAARGRDQRDAALRRERLPDRAGRARRAPRAHHRRRRRRHADGARRSGSAGSPASATGSPRPVASSSVDRPGDGFRLVATVPEAEGDAR